jgi:hypothetical protein
MRSMTCSRYQMTRRWRPMMMRDAAIEGSIDEMVKRVVFVYILELTNSPQLWIFVGLLLSCKCRSIYCGHGQSQATMWLSHDPYVTSHWPAQHWLAMTAICSKNSPWCPPHFFSPVANTSSLKFISEWSSLPEASSIPCWKSCYSTLCQKYYYQSGLGLQ